MVRTEITAYEFKTNNDQEWSFKKNYDIYFIILKIWYSFICVQWGRRRVGEAHILLSGCGGGLSDNHFSSQHVYPGEQTETIGLGDDTYAWWNMQPGPQKIYY